MSCTSQQVAGLNPAQLVQFLQTTTSTCLYDFVWTLDTNMAGVLTDQHVIAVLNEIALVSPAYQGDNQQHMSELMYFAHAAYYLKSYNPADPTLFVLANTNVAAEAALDAFAASAHFNDANTTAASILYDWVNTVDAAVLGHRYYAQLVGILQTFNTQPARWSDYWQGVVAWTTLLAINRQVGINAAFPAQIDQSLIDELTTLAGNTSLPVAAQYLASNAIWVLGGFCKNVPPWKAAAVQAITDVRAVWSPGLTPPAQWTNTTQFTQQWLWTVSTLDDCNNCQDAGGNPLCKSDVIPQLEAQVLPHTYTFDDGAMVVQTPLALADVQPLFHAVKQVEAQFNRLTQTLAPLPGDPNGVLRIVLFGSRADYENYAPFLFNLSTGNGGIYLEDLGTFYTYDRTPQESIYPLEELFRHEFAHYLVGRFLIGGMWGQAPIYQGNRMVWFDEGLAEFCAWSSIAEGIKPRKRLAELVQQDGPNRMTVGQILSASYGDFKFYRYAAFLFAYWHQHDLATLLQIIDFVRAGDVPGYDAKIAQLKADAGLQAAYDQFLDDLVANIAALDDPSTVVPALNALDLALPSDVQTQVRQTRIGYLADCTVAAAQMNTRFSARGTLSGVPGGQQDIVAAWRAFDANLDEMIGELEQQGINNFAALNGRFGKIRWVDLGGGQSYPMADYFVEGPLVQGAAALQPPLQQVMADFLSTRLGVNATAMLVNPTTVEVRVPITTGLRADTTPNALLLAELEDEREELRNQVYAIRPPYYRSLEVDWDGAAQIIPVANQQHYALRNVLCKVQLA